MQFRSQLKYWFNPLSSAPSSRCPYFTLKNQLSLELPPLHHKNCSKLLKCDGNNTCSDVSTPWHRILSENGHLRVHPRLFRWRSWYTAPRRRPPWCLSPDPSAVAVEKVAPARRKWNIEKMVGMADMDEHERKVVMEFCHLLEKSKQLFNGLR